MAILRSSSFHPAVAGAAALAVAVAGTACGSSTESAPSPPAPPSIIDRPRPLAKPLIVDTDMGPDDWTALLYLLHRGDVSIAAITVTGSGEATCDAAHGDPRGALHALDLIDLAGRTDLEIPVACGPASPLRGTRTFPSAWRQDADRLLGLTLKASRRAPATDDAPAVIRTLLAAAAPRSFNVLTLGPLTDLGTVLAEHPELATKIDTVFVTGGAVHVPGDLDAVGITDDVVAEYNMYIDPTAARVVLGADLRVELIALDGTTRAPVAPSFVTEIAARATTPAARFVAGALARRTAAAAPAAVDFQESMAAGVVTQNDLCRYGREPLVVDDGDGPTSGQTRIDPRGHDVDVCIDADGARFGALLLEALDSVVDVTP